MKRLPRSRFHALVGQCLARVWQCLVALGYLHTGPLYPEDSQLVSALGQVGCFVDRATASRHRTPALPDPTDPT